MITQENGEKPRLGMLQELMEAKKENSEVRCSNSSLKAEIARYKADLEAKTHRAHALESNCSAAEESKIVTSKVQLPCQCAAVPSLHMVYLHIPDDWKPCAGCAGP